MTGGKQEDDREEGRGVELKGRGGETENGFFWPTYCVAQGLRGDDMT